MMAEISTAKPCTARCEFFRCGRKMLYFKGGRPWCNFVNEPCTPQTCAYVTCLRGKLISGNKCGLTVKRLTSETTSPNDFKLNIKLRSKDIKRFGGDDLV
ncbi:MAG: hypothetical protein QW738_04675 [Nitrososphaeria archaeon]